MKQIALEVGLHALIFNGANKYPCYAYHDIGTWKGNQYQSGAHLLPWIRAKAQFKYLTVVLGNIFGGQNHQLIEPLLIQNSISHKTLRWVPSYFGTDLIFMRISG
jgi:hypothetical protein